MPRLDEVCLGLRYQGIHKLDQPTPTVTKAILASAEPDSPLGCPDTGIFRHIGLCITTIAWPYRSRSQWYGRASSGRCGRGRCCSSPGSAPGRDYDVRGFVEALRSLRVTPHVARNDRRWGRSALDGRTTRHAGYAVSQRRRKRVEEVFGWLKTVGGGRLEVLDAPERVRLRGRRGGSPVSSSGVAVRGPG